MNVRIELLKKWLYIKEWMSIFYRLRLYVYRKFNLFDKDYTCIPNKYHRFIITKTMWDSNESLKDNWRGNQHWGTVHPNYPYTYDDISCADILSNGNMMLTTKYEPAIVVSDDVVYNPSFVGVDLVPNIEYFSKGVYEIRCKIPPRANATQSFWISGKDSWPPEIDFFEFFGDPQKGNYVRMDATVHWRTSDDEYVMLPMDFKLPESVMTEFNTYTVIFDDDRIEWKFNGLTIRKITDKKILSYLSSKEYYLVIGNEITHFAPETYISPNIYEIESIKTIRI